jgi:hypothetical protein
LATEFAEFYPGVVNKLIDLFQRIKAMDRECSRINSVAPENELSRLDGVELTARGFNHFTIDNPSILETVRLPDIEHSSLFAWPPPQPSMAASFVESQMPIYSRHPGGDWWKEREQRNQQRREEAARVAADYAARQKQREERDNAEVRARADALRKGAG